MTVNEPPSQSRPIQKNASLTFKRSRTGQPKPQVQRHTHPHKQKRERGTVEFLQTPRKQPSTT